MPPPPVPVPGTTLSMIDWIDSAVAMGVWLVTVLAAAFPDMAPGYVWLEALRLAAELTLGAIGGWLVAVGVMGEWDDAAKD